MFSLRAAMDRLLDEWEPQAVGSADFVNPAMDLYQTDEEVVLRASLPGVRPDDLSIQVTGDILTLRGETREETASEGAHYHVRERRAGTFSRAVTLPTGVVAEKADARFQDGILTLRLPKAEEVKPKAISVKAR
jgi:HSP20 family protein